MKRNSTLLFSVVVILVSMRFSTVKSQNLVPNFGFEVQDTCPAVSEIELAQPWDSPTLGSPDLFNSTCGTQNSAARTGIGSSGFYCFSTFPNNREYIQAPLTSTLQAGQTYCVTFYVYRANFRYATNRVGAYFSAGAVNQTTTGVLSFTPQVDNNPTNMLSSANWMQISGSFVANGTETHILIGSFANDANTDTLVANASNNSKVSYYRIDDISVTACAAGIDGAEFAASNILVYPSPANDNVNIRTEIDMKISKVEIISLAGNMVKTQEVNVAGSANITTDISSLENGIYLIAIHTEYGIVNKRIVVNH